VCTFTCKLLWKPACMCLYVLENSQIFSTANHHSTHCLTTQHTSAQSCLASVLRLPTLAHLYLTLCLVSVLRLLLPTHAHLYLTLCLVSVLRLLLPTHAHLYLTLCLVSVLRLLLPTHAPLCLEGGQAARECACCVCVYFQFGWHQRLAWMACEGST